MPLRFGWNRFGGDRIRGEPDRFDARLKRSRLLGAGGRGETSLTARVRPITVMAAAAAVAVVLVGAFALTRDDDAIVGQPAALPILVGARAEAAMAPVTATGPRTFVRGSGLVDPGGSLEAWSVTSADPDPAAVRRLADAFDVSGDLRQIDGGWQIGADGGAAVRVASVPGARWDYSPGGPPMVSMACAVPTTASTAISGSTTASDLPLVGPTPDPSHSSGDVGVDGCTSTPAPEGIPSASEAEAVARDLLRRVGVDVAHMQVRATSDAWGAQVDATPELDGTATFGVDTVVSFGAQAAITSASGWLGLPTKRDGYPLIGIDAAIGRVNEGTDLLDGWVPLPLVGPGIDDATGVSSSSGGASSYPSITDPPTSIPADESTSVPTDAVTDSGDHDCMGLCSDAEHVGPRGRVELGRRPVDDHHGRRCRCRRRRGIGQQRAWLPELDLPGAAVPVGSSLRLRMRRGALRSRCLLGPVPGTHGRVRSGRRFD